MKTVSERSAMARPRAIAKTSIIDSIVSEIKDKIVSGELQDGDVLSSQDELARSMGVSRASLREALNRLSLMGLIEMRHGSGTFVKTAKPLDFMNSLSSMLITDQSSADELLNARLHIESSVAALAAKNASDEDLEELRTLLDRMYRDASTGDANGFIAHDLQFHMVIAESSKNRVLMKVLEIIRDLLRQCIARFYVTFPGNVSDTVEYHARIYEAIRRHDPEGARQEMEDHIIYLIRLNQDNSS